MKEFFYYNINHLYNAGIPNERKSFSRKINEIQGSELHILGYVSFFNLNNL